MELSKNFEQLSADGMILSDLNPMRKALMCPNLSAIVELNPYFSIPVYVYFSAINFDSSNILAAIVSANIETSSVFVSIFINNFKQG